MDSDPDDDRSSEAQGYSWAARVFSISLEMVMPGALGYWLDQRWGTGVWLTIAGVVAGMVLAMWQLLQIAKSSDEKGSSRTEK